MTTIFSLFKGRHLVYLGAFLLCQSAFSKSKIQNMTSKDAAANLEGRLSEAQGLDPSGHEHSIGIGVGQTVLLGDLEEHGENSITWDIIYSYKASYSFDVFANFHYSKHTYKDEFVKAQGMALGLKGKVFQYDAFAPFVLGGVGFYSPKARREINGQLVESESKVTFGLHMGAGAELRVNKFFTAGLMAHYHNPFDIKQEAGPDVDGSYFKILVTGAYVFSF